MQGVKGILQFVIKLIRHFFCFFHFGAQGRFFVFYGRQGPYPHFELLVQIL